MKKDLSGDWLFKTATGSDFLPAVLPGCQFLDLMRNGIIPDPYVGTNEKDVQWVHDEDYIYKKTFALNEEETGAKNIDLVIKGADTIAEIKVNDNVIGVTENCYLEYVFPIKGYLVDGDNDISITFFSPKKYVKKRYREVPTPLNSNGQNGIVHIRKVQCHFGWDWGPVLTPVGISGAIYLDIYDRSLSSPIVKSVKKEDGSFVITALCDDAESIALTDPDGKTTEVKGDKAEFLISDPQIWWTKELSGKAVQPLYTVTAYGYGEELSKKVGLRTIELDRSKDEYGYNFRFILNGVPLFIKGANYIPPDSFITRFDQAQLSRLIDAVLYSNMNMIRVWGGGYYADDSLLDECDRRGILIWQDFPFACQAYPFFEEKFLQNVLNEVDYNVKRISHHPCLAVWCGNNEIEDMHLSWVTMRKYVEWTEKFFYDILPEAIRKIDDLTPYTPGSPIGIAHNKDVKSDYVGDTHLWGVWHGLQPMTHYRKRMTRFCSEFGFESLPDFATVKSYAEEKDYHLNSPVQKAHQKCAGGNDKMLKYIADRFPLSEDIRDLIYLSQITQANCIADATEHWRRNKGRCNGAMYWQLNDCWPTCSWSSYDYYGGYKALLYKGRDFFAPLSISIEDDKDKIDIYLLNDLICGRNVEVEYIKFDFEGKKVEKLKENVNIAPLENKLIHTFFTKNIDNRREGVAVKLYENGVLLQQKTHLLLPEKKLRLPKRKIDVTETIEGGARTITLSSSVYQRLVMLDNESNIPFSDNFFDILPGESKVITQSTVAPLTLTVKTVADIKPAGVFQTLKAKFKVYFSIRNLANMAYHAKVPK